MALSSLGIGIVITVKGNYEQKLRSASNATRTFANLQKDLARKADMARQSALNQAIAFGVLSIRIGQVARVARNLFNSFAGGLGGMIKKSAEFQTQASLLKVFFGDKSETLSGQLQLLAIETGSAIGDLVTVANRLGQIGLKAEDASDATRLVAQAFKTLPAVEKTRALNSMGLAFQTTMSFNRAFNVVLDASEQKLFNAATGIDRVKVGMDALRKRFGNVNDIMSGNLNFQLERLVALFDLLKIKIALPALEPLTKALRRINLQFQALFGFGEKNEKIMSNLQDIFQAVVSPLTRIVTLIADLKLVPKTLQFLSDHKELVKTASAVFLMSAAFMALAGSLAAVSFAALGSVKVFQLTSGPAFFKGMAKSMAGFGTFKGGLFGGARAGAVDYLKMRRRFGGGMANRALGEALRDGAAAKFSSLGSVFSSALSSTGSFLQVIGVIAIKLAAIGAVVAILAIVLRGAFKPLKEGIGAGISNVINLARGLYEVLSTGRISLKVLQQIENSGLRPLYEMFVTLGYFIKDFFIGVFAGSEGLGPVFERFVSVIKYIFIEVMSIVAELLESFGLMQEGGAEGVQKWGYAVGFILKWLVNIIMYTSMAIQLTIVPVFKQLASVLFMVSSYIQFMTSLFFRFIQLLGKIPFIDKLFGLPSGAISEAAKGMAEEKMAGAVTSAKKGVKNSIFGQVAEAAGMTINPGITKVVLNGKEIAEATTAWEQSQKEGYSEALP